MKMIVTFSAESKKQIYIKQYSTCQLAIPQNVSTDTNLLATPLHHKLISQSSYPPWIGQTLILPSRTCSCRHSSPSQRRVALAPVPCLGETDWNSEKKWEGEQLCLHHFGSLVWNLDPLLFQDLWTEFPAKIKSNESSPVNI